MKRFNKCFLVIFLAIILTLTGCSKTSYLEDTNSLREKILVELEYIDNKIIIIMNRLNNIDFSNYMMNSKEILALSENNSNLSEDMKEEGRNNKANSENNRNNIIVTEIAENSTISTDYNSINWNEIEVDIELFISKWNTIIFDLYKINVPGNDIIEFSHFLDKLLISINNKDKISSLSNSASLYSYITKYIEAFDQQSIYKELFDTKLHVLNSYVGATSTNWEYVNTELNLAEDSFAIIMNNLDIEKEKGYYINKSYIALKELENSSNLQDFGVFLIKYKNVMEEMENLIQLDKY